MSAPQQEEPRRLIALAGPVCAGKTTLATSLAERRDARVLAARTVIAKELGGSDRGALQEAGREFEQRTQGRWLAEAAVQIDAEELIIDAARTAAQAERILEAEPDAVLIYLATSKTTCQRRFVERRDPVDAGIDFNQMLAGEPPQQPELHALADLVIETDGLTIQEVAEFAMRFLADRARGVLERDN